MKKHPKHRVREAVDEAAPAEQPSGATPFGQETVAETAEPAPSDSGIVEESPAETEAEDPAASAADRQALAEKQRDEFKDLLLRQTADFENFRRRTERERQMLEETAATNIIHELLPMLDNLERALGAEPGAEGAEAYRQGVELIHRDLLEMLRRRGVKPIEALGAEFDPHFHQAVSYEDAPDRRDGEIVEEFRRGYLLGDRLLRPSMVKVAKG